MSYGLGSVSSMQMMDTVKNAQTVSKSEVHIEHQGEKKVKSHESKDVNPDKVMMERARQQANQVLKQHDRYVEREIHKVTHAVMYKLKDSITDEVLMEFPPEKMQDMIANMWETAGLFIDKEA